jgi:hypothetical protein
MRARTGMRDMRLSAHTVGQPAVRLLEGRHFAGGAGYSVCPSMHRRMAAQHTVP